MTATTHHPTLPVPIAVVVLATLLISLSGCTAVTTELTIGKDLLVTGTVRIEVPKAAAKQQFGDADAGKALADEVTGFNAMAPDGVVADLDENETGFSITVDFEDVRLRPLPAQGGGSFLIYVLPRVDMFKDKYLFQTYHPARALFWTENIDEAMSKMRNSGIEMTMSVTFPGNVINAPSGSTIDGRTVEMDLTKVSEDQIRIMADPPGFPWWTIALIPVVAGAVIGLAVVIVNRLSRAPDSQDDEPVDA